MVALAGFNAKVRINAVAFNCSSYQASDDTPEQDVSNTEAVPGNPAFAGSPMIFPNNNGTTLQGSSFIPGLSTFRASVHNATFDTIQNLFAAPMNVIGGNYIGLVILLNGVGSVSWSAGSFYVSRVSQDQQVRGLQPITFQGVGDGLYSTP